MAGDHACPECGNTFTRPQHVTRHARIHSGERPYACPTCPEAFPRSDLLSRHISRQHNPSGAFSVSIKRKRPTGAVEEDQGRRACGSCAKSKARCDSEEPTCGRCKSKGISCSYPEESSSNGENEARSSSASPLLVASSSDPLPELNTDSLDFPVDTESDTVVLVVENPPSLPSFHHQGSPSSSLASWDSSSDASFSLNEPPPLPSLTTNEFLNASYKDEQPPSMRSFGFGSPSPLLPTRTPSGMEPFVASSLDYALASPPTLTFPTSFYSLGSSWTETRFALEPAVVDSSWGGEMGGLQELCEFGSLGFGEVEVPLKDDGDSFGIVGSSSPPESGHTIFSRTSNESVLTSSSAVSTLTSSSHHHSQSSTSASLHYSPPPTPSASLHYTHPQLQLQTQLEFSSSSSSQRTSEPRSLLQPSYLPPSPLPLTTQDLFDYKKRHQHRQERDLDTFFNTCFQFPGSLSSSYLGPPLPPPPPPPLFERRKVSGETSSAEVRGLVVAGVGGESMEDSSSGGQASVGLVSLDEGTFPSLFGRTVDSEEDRHRMGACQEGVWSGDRVCSGAS